MSVRLVIVRPRHIVLAVLAVSIVACGLTSDSEVHSQRASRVDRDVTSAEDASLARAELLQARQLDADATYELTAPDGKWLASAPCAAQAMVVHFDQSGPLVRLPGGREVRFELTHVGRGVDDGAPPTTDHEVARTELRYRRGALTEWYRNGPLGLEQGFDLDERPTGDGELEIHVTVGGDLVAQLVGDQVVLVDRDGIVRARYGELMIADAGGRVVPSRLDVEGNDIVLAVRDDDATYPIVVDPFVWSEEQKLLAFDGASGDYFGEGLAIDGSTAAIGAFGQGAVYVYTRSGGPWSLQQKITGGAGFYGREVALSGDTLVVGAPIASVGGASQQGRVYVYVRSGGVWTQQLNLYAFNGSATDRFGSSVAIDGDTLVVGAPRQGSTHGAVYVYTRTGTTWTFESWFSVPSLQGDINERFGSAVALEGDRLVVGATGWDTPTIDAGAAFVFERTNGAWSLVQELVAADGATDDYFGQAVDLSGNTVLVGAYGHVQPQVSGGAAYVFVESAGTWTTQQKLVATDPTGSQWFGNTLALDVDTAVIGARYSTTNFYDDGSAYVFRRTGGAWTQETELNASDGMENDHFGSRVALEGGTILVGATGDDDSGPAAGSVFWFEYLFKGNLGDACTVGDGCLSGHCVDGVCCNVSCVTASTSDCLACSAALTGGPDGLCGPISAGTSCRAAQGVCDAEEVCDGLNADCPGDAKSTAVCRPAVDACDAPETCSGSGDTCPPDAKEPSTTECRPAVDLCDVAETCDGTSDACPSDAKAPATTECRAAAGACDVAETCDGIADACPEDTLASDGTSCDDGDSCTEEDTCQEGLCHPGPDTCGDGGMGGVGGTGGTSSGAPNGQGGGGAGADTGGSAGSGDGGAGAAEAADDGGCSCSAPGLPSNGGRTPWTLLALWLAAVAARRRNATTRDETG